MSISEYFVREINEYQRNIDMFEYAKHQHALHLTIRTGRPYDECRAFVDKVTKQGGKFAKRDPNVLSLTRHTEGNREKESITFDEMLEDIKVKHRIISPSMAIYIHPREKRSILGKFTRFNVKMRGVAKKEMFAAERAGLPVLKAIKDGEQGSYKISNNSLSGAHSSKFTPLWLRSAHSSLTSTCRTAAAYANANNEKFLHGNRHYYNPEVIQENIISIIAQTNFDDLENLVRKYQLHLPTVEECVREIRRSSDFYFYSDESFVPIVKTLGACTPLQRAAFMYIGDAYQLANYNPEVMRDFISAMIFVPDEVDPNPDEVMDKLTSDMTAFLASLCAHITKNRTFKDLKENDPHSYGIVAAAARNAFQVLSQASDIIRTLWATDNVPSSVAMFTSATRRAGVVSDTDSTIFTVQNWVEWYTGGIAFDRKANAVRNTMVFFTSQCVIHILAMMSANMGVDTDQLHQLSMKNEFAFPVFGLTTRAKHYFAFISEQEGLVYDKPKKETKGVEMKNTKAPKRFVDAAEKLSSDVMSTIMRGEKVKIIPILKQIGDMEREIIRSFKSGSSELLTRSEIKPAESYNNPVKTSTPYGHYLLWEAVFAPKYGPAPTLPYPVVKVSLELDKPSLFKDWIAGLKDVELAARIRAWAQEYKKTGITNILIPQAIVLANGIPDEIIEGANLRKLVYTTMSTFYIELESLGFYMHNDKLTRLVSDYY